MTETTGPGTCSICGRAGYEHFDWCVREEMIRSRAPDERAAAALERIADLLEGIRRELEIIRHRGGGF